MSPQSAPQRPSASESRPSHELARRGFLGATAVGAATVAAAPAARAEGPSARFALIADTQVNEAQPERTAQIARTLRHIESRDPEFVLHCGDITDHASPGEVASYLDAVPAGLAPRIHHVPGNHETQWNADALEGYREAFGPTFFSVDAAGFHIVGLDPLVSQQWPSYRFDERLLEDLRADLEAVPDGVPILLVNHFPLDDAFVFLHNVEDFLAVIEPYRVRLVFAGHIHRREVRQFNGLTHLVGDALMQAPVYYWAERFTDQGGDRLVIQEVHVPADGEATETLVAEVPLGEEGPGDAFGPLTLEASATSTEISLSVLADPSGDRGPSQWPTSVVARVFPQGTEEAEWSPLTRRGQGPRWQGRLDSSALPPGAHRVQVRASEGDEDPVWNDIVEVTIPADGPRIAWEHELAGGTVMADLAHHEDLVIAATTDGVVEALRVDADGARTAWRREDLGGVYKGPLVVAGGEIVLVGSTDHHLYALTTETGETLWREDLGAPVQCGIALLDLPQGQRIGVAAGTTFFLLDLEGAQDWSAGIGGTFTGTACTDGERVFVGSGDGKVHALDGATGEQVWATMVATKSGNPYHRIIYGAWAAPLQILSTGDLFAPAHVGATTLSAQSGEVRWEIDGLHRVQFTRPVISELGILVFDGKEGDALLLDEATGEALWHEQPFPFVGGSSASWGSSPVPTEDPAVHWMVATTGMLTRIDLAAPEFTTLLAVSDEFTTSTPILYETQDLVVTVNQPGVVRGLTGLREAHS